MHGPNAFLMSPMVEVLDAYPSQSPLLHAPSGWSASSWPHLAHGFTRYPLPSQCAHPVPLQWPQTSLAGISVAPSLTSPPTPLAGFKSFSIPPQVWHLNLLALLPHSHEQYLLPGLTGSPQAGQPPVWSIAFSLCLLASMAANCRLASASVLW